MVRKVFLFLSLFMLCGHLVFAHDVARFQRQLGEYNQTYERLRGEFVRLSGRPAPVLSLMRSAATGVPVAAAATTGPPKPPPLPPATGAQKKVNMLDQIQGGVKLRSVQPASGASRTTRSAAARPGVATPEALAAAKGGLRRASARRVPEASTGQPRTAFDSMKNSALLRRHNIAGLGDPDDSDDSDFESDDEDDDLGLRRRVPARPASPSVPARPASSASVPEVQPVRSVPAAARPAPVPVEAKVEDDSEDSDDIVSLIKCPHCEELTDENKFNCDYCEHCFNPLEVVASTMPLGEAFSKGIVFAPCEECGEFIEEGKPCDNCIKPAAVGLEPAEALAKPLIDNWDCSCGERNEGWRPRCRVCRKDRKTFTSQFWRCKNCSNMNPGDQRSCGICSAYKDSEVLDARDLPELLEKRRNEKELPPKETIKVFFSHGGYENWLNKYLHRRYSLTSDCRKLTLKSSFFLSMHHNLFDVLTEFLKEYWGLNPNYPQPQDHPRYQQCCSAAGTCQESSTWLPGNGRQDDSIPSVRVSPDPLLGDFLDPSFVASAEPLPAARSVAGKVWPPARSEPAATVSATGKASGKRRPRPPRPSGPQPAAAAAPGYTGSGGVGSADLGGALASLRRVGAVRAPGAETSGVEFPVSGDVASIKRFHENKARQQRQEEMRRNQEQARAAQIMFILDTLKVSPDQPLQKRPNETKRDQTQRVAGLVHAELDRVIAAYARLGEDVTEVTEREKQLREKEIRDLVTRNLK